MTEYQKVYSPDQSVQLKGRWTATLIGPDGRVKTQVVGSNVVCTNGKEYLASFLSSAAAGATAFNMKYVGIGSDATSEAAANTALGTELARTTGTALYISGAIYQVSATFPAGTGTGAIVEYGVFSANSGGTMLNRDTEAVINKGASDELQVRCQLTIA